MLFDLLMHCPSLRDDIAREKVGFGINLTMYDFANQKKKNLDLVICTPGPSGSKKRRLRDLVALASDYNIALNDEDLCELQKLPKCLEVPVGDVLIALEAKAAMTAHQRALPRLFDELNSSHNIVHGHSATTIAAGLVMVNAAESFVSPDKNRFALGSHPAEVSAHNQPKDAGLVVNAAISLPKRADTSGKGFDALGIMVINCRNDGSQVTSVAAYPAPKPADTHSYDNCIRRICSSYRSRFPLI